MNERRWDDCITNEEGPATRSGTGVSFFVLGGIVLLLHHGWVAGLGKAPFLEAIFVGCVAIAVNVASWISPTLQGAIEGQATAPRWQRFIWWIFIASLGLLLTWAVGHFLYGIDWFW